MQCKNRLSKLFLAVLMVFFVTGARFQGPSLAMPVTRSTLGESSQAKVLETYGKLPLSFEANRGQTDGQVKFLSRGSGYSLFLTPTEAVLALRKPAAPEAGDGEVVPNAYTVLRSKLVGANPEPRVVGLQELRGKSNYFLGNDPEKWRTNVPYYRKVKYEEVYVGVDLIYYGNQRQIEYDFVVAPGADPNAISLGFEGADSLEIDSEGNLVLITDGGEVILQAPIIYQEIEGTRQQVPGYYVLKDKRLVGFQVSAYDIGRPLIIDPVLIYATYLGGSDLDSGKGIAVDANSNAYITGYTYSLDFPMLNPLQATGTSPDIFVTKLNAEGTALVYSTYLGGQGTDYGYSIAVDAAGNAYVTGDTSSGDFPTVNAFQDAPGGVPYSDAFVAKLNALGDELVYSTYLGGANSDSGNGIAVDSDGSAYVIGTTKDDWGVNNFPTVNALQGTPGGGNTYDAFITKLHPLGSELVYSTFLGGSGGDYGRDIAVDPSRNVYVSGTTYSTDFPLESPFWATTDGYEAFVAKINNVGSALIYSTYLGGSGGSYADEVNAIAVDVDGNAYVTGKTDSTNFPMVNPFQDIYGGGHNDAFVTKFDSAGNALYSTYLGGNAQDEGRDIAVDPSGCAHVTGIAHSTDFPIVNPIPGSNEVHFYDAFLTKLSADGSELIYSSFLGGEWKDHGEGIALDVDGNIYVVGGTTSTRDLATASAFQPTIAGHFDAFIAKISPVLNSAPVADDQPVTTAEDTQVPITLTASDVDGDSLTYTVLSGPAKGTLSGAAPNLTYTPNADFNGLDGFTFKVNDGTLDSNAATVSITVNPVNDAPMAVNDTASTDEDTPVDIDVLANDTDVDGDSLRVDSVTQGTNGSVTNNGSDVTYTPDADFCGSDSFTYTASDGNGGTDTATVDVTITYVNDAPVAKDDAYGVDEDDTLTMAAPGVLGNDSDVENEPFTAVLVSGPANGSLTLNANGSFTYTPNPDFNGTDSFTYRAYDGTDYSNVATVNITIIPVNDAPVANDQSVTTDEDTPLDITLAASDVDKDTLTYTIVSQPQHGTLSGTAPDVTYTPDPNYNGSDSFTYKANDGDLDSNVATVTITINPVNDAPVAVDDTATTQEDTPVTIAVLANDSDLDADTLTVESVTQPASGSVTNNGTDVTYTPDVDYCESDSFTYTASDGNGGTDTATVNVTVACVNDPPMTVDDAYSVDEDDTLTVAAPGVLGNDSDVEGDALTAVLVSNVTNGTLALNADGSFTYIPDANFNGTDSFTYKANDGATDSNIATLTIAVNSVNDAPVAVDETATTDEDMPVDIDVLANDSDIDGDELTVESVTQGANGTVTIKADGTVTYSPNPGYSGTDTFTYTVSDGNGGTATAAVTVTVIPANTPPTANAGGSYSVDEGGSVPVNASGSDPENDPLTFAWDLDNDGTFETPGQSVTFSAAGLDGPSSHTIAIQVTDDGGLSDTDQTAVEVLNVAPTAIFANTSGAVNEGETATLAFSNQFDPSAADAAAGFLYSYDCTDDGTFELSDDPAASFVCHYPDNGTFTARGRIKDKDGGFTDYTVELTVDNVAPTVGEITAPLDPVEVNTSINASADFTDPGVLDTHTAVWDWGDGSQCNTATDLDCSVTESSGSGSATGSHTYTTPGVYTVKLTVTDKDGGSGESMFEFVVVYDPEGGFVTGGGWINSPPGACRFDACTDNTTGKANFGFVSKYKKAADVPTGETEFQFKAGNLNFHSDSYEWLVVAGPKAMYKGVGTINGVGNYGFMLSAIDEKLTPSTDVDLFRIKIWDKDDGGTIVYDNQMGAEGDADPTTAIGGGNIVIHK